MPLIPDLWMAKETARIAINFRLICQSAPWKLTTGRDPASDDLCVRINDLLLTVPAPVTRAATMDEFRERVTTEYLLPTFMPNGY